MSAISIHLYFLNLLIPICLISNIALAQVDDSSRVSENDSRGTVIIHEKLKAVYPLNPHFNLTPMRLSLSKAKYIDDFSYIEFKYGNQLSLDDNTFYNLKQMNQPRLQNDLRNTFEWLQKDQQKYDLGWIGQALGYVNAAAALGLAAYHLYKYEIKKNKDD